MTTPITPEVSEESYNARLVAAAPEMLDALRRLLNEWESLIGMYDDKNPAGALATARALRGRLTLWVEGLPQPEVSIRGAKDTFDLVLGANAAGAYLERHGLNLGSGEEHGVITRKGGRCPVLTYRTGAHIVVVLLY